MGGACSAYFGGGRRVQSFGEETWGKEATEDPGVDGRIILKWISRKWDVGI
jgi:hypothetical protein